MKSQDLHKVIFVESASAMGGVQFSTLYLAQSLDRARWYPIVLCPEPGDLPNACQADDIEARIVRFPKLRSTSVRVGRNARLPNLFAWLWNAMALLRAKRVLQKEFSQTKPDVVVTKGLSSHFIGGLAARASATPCVWHVQDLISERSLGIYRRIFAFAAARLPQHIIVDGAAIRKQLPPAIHSRVSVIHNGVDTSVFRPGLDGSAVRREFGITAEQIVIGHAARITPWKGQHYLIEAFAKIADAHPNTVLLLVGSPVFDHDGYEQRLKSMVAEFGLGQRVKFAGYRHDMPEVLAATDVFAFTSIEKDTSPLALLSAMASGLPIVAFDIEGVRELDDSGSVFALARVADADALAESLSSVLRDSLLREQLQNNARSAAERLSLDRYVAAIDQVFANACNASDDPSIDIAPTREPTKSQGARAVSTASSLSNG